ncbi:MAG: phage tail tape measure protein [Pseudomonadales bacterium]|nr:phage tail tape measure protein [Pseudomonadales bacterium]
MTYKSRLVLAVDTETGEQNLKQLAGELERTGSVIEPVRAAFAGLTSATSLAASAVDALQLRRIIEESTELDSALRNLEAATNLPVAQIRALEEQARTLGATSQFTAAQVVSAQQSMIESGLEYQEVTASTPDVLRLSTIANMELGQAAVTTTQILRGMGLQAEQLGRVIDVVAVAATNSHASVGQMGAALAAAAPVAAAAGVGVEDVAAAVAVLADSGDSIGVAGEGIVGVMSSLANVTPEAEAVLTKYGLSIEEVNVEQRGLASVLASLEKANLSASDRFAVFGKEVGSVAKTLIEGSSRVADFEEKLSRADGSASAMAWTLSGGLDGSLTAFNSMVSESMLKLGRDSGMARALQDVVNTGTGVLAVYNDLLPEFIAANPSMEDQATNLELMADGLSTVAGVAAGAAGGFAAYRSATMLATAAQWAFNAATKANPIGLILSAAGAAAGAIYSFSRSLDPAAKKTERLKANVSALTSGLYQLSRAELENRQVSFNEDMLKSLTEAEKLEIQLSTLEDKILKSGQLTSEGGALPIATAEDIQRARDMENQIDELKLSAESSQGAIAEVEKLIASLGKGELGKCSDGVGDGGVSELATRQVKSQIHLLETQIEAIKGGATAQAAKNLADSEALRIRLESQGVEGDQIRTLISLQEALRGLTNNEYGKWISRLKDSIDPMQTVEEEIAKIWDAFESDKDSFGDIDRSQIQSYVDSLREAASKGGAEFEHELSQSIDRVAASLQSAIATGDWQGVGTTIGTVLSDYIGAKVSAQLTQQMAGQGGSAILGPIASALAGGVVGAAVAAVSDYFHDDQDPTEDRQAVQGTGTVLGSIEAKSESIAAATELTANATGDLVSINQGVLSALERVQLGIDGATAMIARGVDNVSFDVALGSHLSKSQQQGVGLMAAAGGTIGGLGAAGLVGTLGFSSIPALMLSVLGGAGALDPVLDIADKLTLGLLGKIGKAIGGKTKQIDEGIRIMGGQIGKLADEMLVQAFVTYKTKKHALDDYDTHERFEALDDEVTRQFELVMGDIYDSVSAGAEALGILPADVKTRLDEFVLKTQRISLEGLDDAEQQAEIQAVFSTIFDDLAETAVPFLEELQKAGEGPGETLARVATELGLLQEMATLLNAELQAQTPRDSSIAASEFSGLVGGSENLANEISSLEANFLSETEQFEALSRRLGAALGELPLPETRDAYLEQIRVLLQGDAAAREHAASYLRLQAIANDYYDYLEDIAETEARTAERTLASVLSLTDEALSDLQASIRSRKDALSDAYRDEQEVIREAMDARLSANRLASDAAQEGLRTLQQEIQGIESAASGLTKAFQPIQQNRRESALGVLRDALASGDLTGTGDAAAIVGEIGAGNYASRVEYERAQGRSLGLLEALQVEGTQQLTVAEQALAALQHQADLIRQQGQDALDQATQAYEDEIAALDQMLLGAEEQINTLRGIETGVLSVADAIANMASALGQEVVAGHNPDDPIATLEQLYRTLLGREIGQEGRSYWSSMLANGATLADVEWGIRHSDEFRNRNSVASLGFAAKELASRQLHIPSSPQPSTAPVLHDYVPAKDRQSSSNSALVREIQQLRAELMAVQEGIALNTSRIANNSDRMETLGVKSRKEELV